MPKETSEAPTKAADVTRRFHSMFQTRYEIPDGLELEWLKTAVEDYELNVARKLGYDAESGGFEGKLDGNVLRTLASMMYVSYLQRELSRVMALNGIYGKDVHLTGQDATKRVTKQELDSQIALVETLLHRQKNPAY